MYIIGCPVGYFAKDCRISCPYPLYGEECQGKCKCQEKHCDFVLGCDKSKIQVLSKRWS